MFSDEARFWMKKVDGSVSMEVERGTISDCCIERDTPYNLGSVMIWARISMTVKTRPVVIATQYDILEPLALPYIPWYISSES